MKNRKEYSENEWQKIAAKLSGEEETDNELLSGFMDSDDHNAGVMWEQMRMPGSGKETDIDKAWDKVKARINADETENPRINHPVKFSLPVFMKIAAVALIILGLGSAAIFINNSGYISKKNTASTGNDEKNIEVSLSDGSRIVLNRNTTLSYRSNFGKKSREVSLSGEAFFEISPDASKPFIIDAGKANVKVIGTSFNVITENELDEVEVYVKTGKVEVFTDDGLQSLILDPEFVGTIDLKASDKKINDNPNYLSWNTEYLDYDGQKLELVFRDLKRVYNMDIKVDDPGILEYPWTSPIDNQPQDTIIRLICGSFNLSYTKDDGVYHLTKK